MRLSKLFKVTGITLAVLAILAVLSVAALFGFFYWKLQSLYAPETGQDEQRLEELRADPMHSIFYPNATELRRVERGSGGFAGGVEDPPTITYFAGTSDNDEDIIQFFIDAATSNGWSVFRGPRKLSTAEKLGIIFRKDDIVWVDIWLDI